jgi:hypothetical protein
MFSGALLYCDEIGEGGMECPDGRPVFSGIYITE